MLLFFWIPPTRFELVSPAPKAGMIDHYTTGVLIVLWYAKKDISDMLFWPIRIPFVPVKPGYSLKKRKRSWGKGNILARPDKFSIKNL
jgi:hypothetical protein